MMTENVATLKFKTALCEACGAKAVKPYPYGHGRRVRRPRLRLTARMRHTADWWAKRIEELAQSGDACAVARRHGVRERTLIWWRSELRRRARKETKPRLLPVVVRAVLPQASPHAPRADELEVFVEIGAARMTVRGAVSAEHLAALVTASARA
jgi:hypothetical protein